MQEPDGKGFAYPMVAVYLLGHKVGNIKEPIVYINHDVYDYNGDAIAKGNEEPFVESLTHNSIIVQIPRLRGNVNNRLERVLSVFDQTQITEGDSQQVLTIDEDKYADDNEMLYVLHRLTAAAANSELRQDMNVEDEYYQAIEDRDTAIMERDKMLKEREELLSQQEQKLSQQEQQLSQKDEQLSQKDEQLRNMAKALFAEGLTEEQISAITGMDVDNVAKLLK